MACYQSLTRNGVPASSGPHATEADCLQACREGACCEGTTCTVKPQCQCRCASNSCCGPDTMTVNGITGPLCRGGTKSECDARGGTWRPCIGCSADAANPAASICRSSDSPSPAQPVEPVFKGVGTTCADGAGFCCGPDTWQAQALIVGSGTVSFPSSQSFPKCGVGGSTRAACESAGGQWITSPCVSCAEVNEKTGIGGSQKFVCYPSANPLP